MIDPTPLGAALLGAFASSRASRPKLRLHEPEEVDRIHDGARGRQEPDRPRVIDRVHPEARAIVKATVRDDAWPLLLHGPSWVGKTSCALCLCDRVPWADYTTASRLCERLIAAQKGELWYPPPGGGQASVADVWHEVSRAPLLVLDELGRGAAGGGERRLSAFHIETVTRVLDERHGLPLVLISNWTPDQIRRDYDDRVYRRATAGTVFAYPERKP